MSKFSKKIFSGKSADDNDWNNFLKEYHASRSGITQACFADFKTDIGPNSYDLLLRELDQYSNQQITLLDLACGDGYMTKTCLKKLNNASEVIGVDMVQEEIDGARKLIKDPRVDFKCEAAQKLSLKSESVDIILCHLALMLMLPVEPVINEISRVLKPGGKLAAVVSGSKMFGDQSGGMHKILGEVVNGFIKEKFSNAASFRTGDERITTEEGLKSLFNSERGFDTDINVLDFTLYMHGTPQKLWDVLKNFYIMALIPDNYQNEFKDHILKELSRQEQSKGIVKLDLPLRKFVVRKAS